MTEDKKFEDFSADELKDLKIKFAPGCFDHFEGTQEELDELIAEITTAIANGDLLDQSEELTDEAFAELPEEIQLQLLQTLDNEFDDNEDQDLSVNTHRRLQ